MTSSRNQPANLPPTEARLRHAGRVPPGGHLAMRLYPWRYALLGLYLLVLAGMYGAFSVLELLKFSMPWQLLAGGSLFFYGLQAAFLTGAPHWRWPHPTGRRPMWVSLVVGGLCASLLTLGFAATLVSLLKANRAVGNLADALNDSLGRPPGEFPWLLILFPLAAWAGWLLFFALVWAGQPLWAFRRVYRLILAGSILELLVTIPVDVQVRKRTDCYCGEGTFIGLIVGITMAAWAFGPGLVLLFLARRLQRRRELQVCVRCGYDLRRLPGTRCPECGLEFEPSIARNAVTHETASRPW